MNVKRLDRIGQEIKKVVSETLREMKDPRIHPLTSITQVRVTNDLGFANIHVSVYGTQKEKEDTLLALEKARGFIRKTISSNIDLRHTPEPKFLLDESIEEASNMQELIRKVRAHDRETDPSRDDTE